MSGVGLLTLSAFSQNPYHAAPQIQPNCSLVKTSQGLLAPVTGSERYLTCDKSYVTAGLKAAMANAKGIDDMSAFCTNGNIDPDKLCQGDEAFKVLLTRGWTWDVIPAWVEENFPELPDLAVKAFNIEHQVPQPMGYLETASAIADQAASGDAAHWDAFFKSIRACSPCCGEYLEEIA